jgi:hypothetical protein
MLPSGAAQVAAIAGQALKGRVRMHLGLRKPNLLAGKDMRQFTRVQRCPRFLDVLADLPSNLRARPE